MNSSKSLRLIGLIIFSTFSAAPLAHGMWDGISSRAAKATTSILNGYSYLTHMNSTIIALDTIKYDKLFSENPEKFWGQYGKILPFYLRIRYINKAINYLAKNGVCVDPIMLYGKDLYCSSHSDFDSLVTYFIAPFISPQKSNNLYELLEVEKNHPRDTLSDSHMKEHQGVIFSSFSTLQYRPKIKKLFKEVLQKQHFDKEKGDCCLIHGRQPAWHYAADIYKKTFNLTQSIDKQIGDDYVFLRFDDSKRRTEDERDVLFMNAALFGNCHNRGSCTALYVMQGTDMSKGPSYYGFSPQSFFTKFKLLSYYEKYAAEFTQLEQLFHQANPHKHGQLLAVSIAHKDIGKIKTLYSHTTLQDSIESGKIDDQAEYILDMDKDYLLDPYNGPRIYSFNAYDQEKFKEYETARDQLFAQIRADIEADKKQQNTNLQI